MQHLHGAHGVLRGPPRRRRLRARVLPRVPVRPHPRQGRDHRRRRGAVPRPVVRRGARPGALPRGSPFRRVRAVVRQALRVHVPRRAAHLLPVPGLLRDDGGGRGRRRRRRRGERDPVRVPGVQTAVLRAVRRGAVARRRDLRRVPAARQGQGGHEAVRDGRGDEVEAVPQVPVLRGESRWLPTH